MKNIKTFLFMLLVGLSFGLVACSTKESSTNISNAYITIDINPSIEIITGDDGLVAQVNALNDDAALLLLETNFVGKTVEEVVEAIINLATDMGYIDIAADENAIIITTETENEDDKLKLEKKIQERIQKVAKAKAFKMQVIKGNTQVTDEFKARAEELGVSIGKLRIVDLALQFDETLTIDVAATMSVKDLNRIIIDAREEMKDLYGEEFHKGYLGLKEAFKKEYRVNLVQAIYDAISEAEDEVFAAILENTDATAEDIRNLYFAYLEELLTINDENHEQVMNNIQNEIANNLTLNGLITLRNTLTTQLGNLRESFSQHGKKQNEVEQILNQLREGQKQLDGLNQQIKAEIQNCVKTIMEANHEYRIEFNFENGFEFEVKFNFNEKFEEIRMKYVLLFEEIGINISELESLFMDAVAGELNNMRQQLQQQLEQFKNEHRSEIEARMEKLQEERQMKQEMWKK